MPRTERCNALIAARRRLDQAIELPAPDDTPTVGARRDMLTRAIAHLDEARYLVYEATLGLNLRQTGTENWRAALEITTETVRGIESFLSMGEKKGAAP